MILAENYEREVNQAVKRFRKGVDKIETSDNPYYHDKAVRDYEIQKLRKELEKAVEEVETRFNAEIDVEIGQAEHSATRSYFTPTTADKLLVADAVSELVADVTLAYNDKEKLNAFNRFESRIDSLEASGLSEVKRKLPEVLSAIGQDQVITSKLKGLNAALRELRTPEKQQLVELQDLKTASVSTSFNRLKLTHPAFKDYTKNRYYGVEV